MGLDGLLQPAPISDAPGGSAVDIDVGPAAASADRHPSRVLPGRGDRRSAGGLKGRSAREEIVRRLDRTIRAAQLARDLLRCQHDLAHGFFNG